MHSARKYLIGLIVAGFAAFLVWAFLQRVPAPNQVKLPDGRVVQLAGMSEGQAHSLKRGWRGKLSGLLPSNLKRLMGPDFRSSFGFGRPGLALWVMCYDPAAAGYQSGWMQSAVVVDEHGCEFPAQGWGSTGDGYYFANVVNFPTYPRDARRFVCRFYDLSAKKIAEIPVAHEPLHEAPPRWDPEQLPVWRTNGPLVLRIDGFEGRTKPSYQMFQRGREESFWGPENTFFEDASGNSGEMLCRMIPAWRWNATFHRTEHAPFAPEEVTTFTNLVVPPAGQMVSFAASGTIAGKAITNLALGGPGRYDWSNGVLVASRPWKAGMGGGHGSSSSSGPGGTTTTTQWRETASLSLYIPRIALPQDAKLIVRAWREGALLGVGTPAGSANDLEFFDFPPDVSAGPVDIDVILDPGYRFDAKIAPDIILALPKE